MHHRSIRLVSLLLLAAAPAARGQEGESPAAPPAAAAPAPAATPAGDPGARPPVHVGIAAAIPIHDSVPNAIPSVSVSLDLGDFLRLEPSFGLLSTDERPASPGDGDTSGSYQQIGLGALWRLAPIEGVRPFFGVRGALAFFEHTTNHLGNPGVRTKAQDHRIGLVGGAEAALAGRLGVGVEARLEQVKIGQRKDTAGVLQDPAVSVDLATSTYLYVRVTIF
jgi:hypothetical protein